MSLRWSCTTGNSVGSRPAVASATVYTGSDDHKVHALAIVSPLNDILGHIRG